MTQTRKCDRPYDRSIHPSGRVPQDGQYANVTKS